MDYIIKGQLEGGSCHAIVLFGIEENFVSDSYH